MTSLPWPVIWQIWIDLARRAGSPRNGRKLQHLSAPASREFALGREATAFTKRLRDKHGRGNVVFYVTNLRSKRQPSPKPEQPLLSGSDWPIQRRP